MVSSSQTNVTQLLFFLVLEMGCLQEGRYSLHTMPKAQKRVPGFQNAGFVSAASEERNIQILVKLEQRKRAPIPKLNVYIAKGAYYPLGGFQGLMKVYENVNSIYGLNVNTVTNWSVLVPSTKALEHHI